jgi:polar amino acid transport system substrate-binding protein
MNGDLHNRTSSAKGLVVSVIRELMKRVNQPYKIQFMPPKRAIVMAERTKDFCVFPISRSQERETSFSWVSPVLISRHAFYSLKRFNHPLKVMKDAKPFRIGATLGDGVGEYLENQGFNVDYTGKNALNAEKLSLQRIDLWLSDTISAPYLARQKGIQINAPELVFFTTLKSMGCQKDINPALVKRMSDTLNGMYRDGTIKKIYKQLGFVFGH